MSLTPEPQEERALARILFDERASDDPEANRMQLGDSYVIVTAMLSGGLRRELKPTPILARQYPTPG